MLYEKLLSQVINIHFPENKFDLKGKLEWYPVTEKKKPQISKRFILSSIMVLVTLLIQSYSLTQF